LSDAYTKFEAINPDKAKAELGFARQLFQNNVELQKCEPQSILDAIVNVARTSVTLNPVMRLAYLIPRKNKCTLEFSYMGLVAMLRDYGCIKSISAHIVYEDEEFEYEISENKIKHRPKFAKSESEHNKREIIGCYSRATLLNNDIVFEFMPMWEIMKVKSKSTGSNSEKSAWNTWRDEMIKKTVIKRHFKLLISLNSHEVLTQALAIENENNPLIDNFNSDKTTFSISNSFDFIEEIQEEPILEIQQTPQPIKEESEKLNEEPILEIKNSKTSNNTESLDWELPTKNKDEKQILEEKVSFEKENNFEDDEDDDIRFEFPDNDEDEEEEENPSALF
jgi:phage RecT family recombinase